MKTLYQRLVEVMKPEEIDHHNSDLYVRVTTDSKRTINEYFAEQGLEIGWFVSIFTSNIPSHCLWYDIAFAYDPFWEEARKK